MTPVVGGHLSVAKGLKSAVESIQEMGGSAIQIFSGSPRSWARKPIDEVLLKSNKNILQNSKITLATHALYLVNLTPDKDELLEKSMNALAYDLEFTAKLGGVGVVVHLGSHLGKGFDAVKDALIERLDRLLSSAASDATLLIENSAGQSGKLGSSLEEIEWILEQLEQHRQSGKLGWCFDTCHGFAAGYDLSKLDELISSSRLQKSLKLIHVNDSKDPWKSGRDRHENLGEGQIGEVVMRSALNANVCKGLPMILEVPGIEGNGPDKENVQRLRSYVGF